MAARPRFLRIGLALTLGTGLTAPALAQADTSAVPRRLVTALLTRYADMYGGDPDPRITVGAIPSALASRVPIPPGATILGTVDWRPGLNVIGYAAGSPDSVSAWFAAEFRRRGYKPVIADKSRFGFVPAVTGPASAWCDGNRQLSPRARGARYDAFASEFEIHVEEQSDKCDTPANRAPSDPRQSNPRNLPLLFDPASAQRSRACLDSFTLDQMAQFPDVVESGFRSTMTPAQLVLHYGRQLDSLGWKRENIPAPVAGTWTRTDSAGARTSVVLIVGVPVTAADCREAQLRALPPGR